ncbi:maleate cis-trans isomerase [Thermodesulfobacteriota bacterium]
MYGWRARIGEVFPSRGDTFMYEFYQMVPKGIVLVSHIIGLYNLTEEEFSTAYLKYMDGARDLARVGVDVIALGGGPLFQLKGFGSEVEMIQAVEKETGIPTITSLTADVEALHFLKMKKLAIVTPYRDEVNQRNALWYQEAGFDVLKIKGVGIQKNSDIASLPFYTAYQLAQEAFLETPGVDGIFIDCARWATIEVIEKLEQDLGVPVVSANQAMIWLALRKSNVRENIHGYGKLMRG